MSEIFKRGDPIPNPSVNHRRTEPGRRIAKLEAQLSQLQAALAELREAAMAAVKAFNEGSIDDECEAMDALAALLEK